MVAQHALDPSLPGLTDVIDTLTKATFKAAAANPYEQEIRRASARALVERLMWLAGGAPMPEVRAEASTALKRIEIGELALTGGTDGAAQQLIAADVKRFLERPIEPIRTPATFDAPPGAPIGDAPLDWLASPPWYIREGGGL